MSPSRPLNLSMRLPCTLKCVLPRQYSSVAQTVEWATLSSNVPLKTAHLSSPDNWRQLPGLEHGLERVLFNPGVHFLQDPRTNLYNFDPYLKNIIQPDSFNFELLPAYKRPSDDGSLIHLAQQHQKRYAASTSSMTQLLLQMYFLISNHRLLNTMFLSRYFFRQPRTFTRLSRESTSVLLLPQAMPEVTTPNTSTPSGPLYVLDPDKAEIVGDARILLDLGKSMEAMLTLPESEFKKLLHSATDKNSPLQDSIYYYGSFGDLFVRAQLDCQHPHLPLHTFDLKSRAALPIRYDILRYREHLNYRLRKRQGLFESFEREVFDMLRSILIKYTFQAKLGRMDGVFVSYHNTNEIFGFEYFPLDEMETIVFGNSKFGNTAFQMSMKLLNQVLNIVTNYLPKQPLRLTIRTRCPASMSVTIPIAERNTDQQAMDLYAENIETGQVKKFVLNVESIVNGIKTTRPYFREYGHNEWKLRYRLEEEVHASKHHRIETTYESIRKRATNNVRKECHYVSRLMEQLKLKKCEKSEDNTVKSKETTEISMPNRGEETVLSSDVQENTQEILHRDIQKDMLAEGNSDVLTHQAPLSGPSISAKTRWVPLYMNP